MMVWWLALRPSRTPPDEISFVAGRRQAAALAQTRAGAVVVNADMLGGVTAWNSAAGQAQRGRPQPME